MKGIAVVAMIALAAGNAASTTTGKRVGGAAVGGVFGAAVAGPVGAAAGAAAGAATAPSIVRWESSIAPLFSRRCALLALCLVMTALIPSVRD
jgi:hypothetical protein